MEGEPQIFKIPHLRNLYQKVEMFGMPEIASLIVPGTLQGPDGEALGIGESNAHRCDQIRGFGFLRDGAVDTLNRFHSLLIFSSAEEGLWRCAANARSRRPSR